jgi:hypothetical protein
MRNLRIMGAIDDTSIREFMSRIAIGCGFIDAPMRKAP